MTRLKSTGFKVMSRFDVWLFARHFRISANKSLMKQGKNLLKKLPTRTSKMYFFADLRYSSKRSLSSSVRDMSLNNPPYPTVSRSRLMRASTKKTRIPKSKACSKMLQTTRGIYRPFITKKQFVNKLKENRIFLTSHRLTKHMVRWGYPREERNRRGDKGWLNIQFLNSMLGGSGDF